MNTLLPVLIAAAILPLALFGGRLRARMPKWLRFAVPIVFGVFFGVYWAFDPSQRAMYTVMIYFSALSLLLEMKSPIPEVES